MNRNEKTQNVINRLERLGIKAMPDGNGKIILTLVSQETKDKISLPPEAMENLVDRACEIGLQSLADGVLENIVVTLYNKEYVYCK